MDLDESMTATLETYFMLYESINLISLCGPSHYSLRQLYAEMTQKDFLEDRLKVAGQQMKEGHHFKGFKHFRCATKDVVW